jgi:DNA-binding PadR family transcriptional regulator
MIAIGKRSGYEIKQLVDKSTRHFWAASYGQIYPELRRLEQDGLIAGRSEPSGGRARTVYELTPSGEQALRRWVTSDQEPLQEMRDEGLLRLFFSDVGDPAERIELLRSIARRQRRKLEQLCAVGPVPEEPTTGPALTLQYGIGFNQWIVDWCESTARRLAADIEKE